MEPTIPISKDLKNIYENPSSIFYHAATTDNPSTLPSEFADWLMASPTPERVRELRARLGNESMGVIQRAVMEKLLGRTGTGESDYLGFPDRLAVLGEDFRDELFGPEHNQALRDIASTAQALNADDSRSGSEKATQKYIEIGLTLAALIAAIWEVWKGHPWAATLTVAVPLLYHVGQYGLARLMTSSRFTDWLMRD